jgi:predicted PurR-regulated permease PerM
MSSPPPAPSNGLGEHMPRWWWKAVAVFWLGGVVVLMGRWLFARLHTLLVILLVSLFLSLAIEPAVNALARKGWKRGAATGVVMAGVVLATLVFIAAIGTLVVRQVANLIDRAPDYIEQLQNWINRTFDANVDLNEVINSLTREGGPLRNFAERFAGQSVQLGTTALGVVLQMFSIFLFTFYMVADGPRLRRAICSVLRPDLQRSVLLAWDTAIEKTGGYLYSRALLAFISTVAHAIVLTAVGVPYPVALALWVGIISQFIPVVGTYLAGLLPIVVALVSDPIDALWVLAFVILYQQVENYVLAPRISARTMELHPAVAFGAAIAGGAMLGPVGALLALPAAASVQAFVGLYVRRHDVVDDHLTSHTPPARRRRRRPRPPAAET